MYNMLLCLIFNMLSYVQYVTMSFFNMLLCLIISLHMNTMCCERFFCRRGTYV